LKGELIVIKRFLLSIVGVYVIWAVLDFILNSLILRSNYGDKPELWRTWPEMKIWLTQLVTFVSAVVFTTIYAFLIRPKSVFRGILYGLLYGVAAGVSMGFGSYSAMPIPIQLAAGWFLGTVVEIAGAGLLVGVLMRMKTESA
jgi:hypothetical protein